MEISIALDTLLLEWTSTGEGLLDELEQLNIHITNIELEGLIKEVIARLEKHYVAVSCQNGKR